MNKELEGYIATLAIDKLMNSEVGDKIEQAMALFEKVQNHFYALSEKEGEEAETTVKVVTVMTFSILKKFAEGKKPSELNSDDWKDIAGDVSTLAILQSDRDYSKFVFTMYERFIRFSAEQVAAYTPENKTATIVELADNLQLKTMQLDADEITEVDYIEECLWTCLEAMIKLVATTAYKYIEDDYAELAQAVAAYAFEYGRFILYSREQAIINELIEAQYQLDEALREKYELYLRDLEEQAEQFYVLIDNAFVPNFREAFLYSIKLAQAAGVEDKKILKNLDEVDEFFM